MWKPEHRAAADRRGLRYESDLTDAEWALIRRLLPPHPPWGKDPHIPRREIVNAIFYINKHGCTWRGLPHDFPA